VIRDQTLMPGEYVAVRRTFDVPGHRALVGQVMAEHPEIWVIDSREAHIGAQGQRVIYSAQSWHTNQTVQARPPKITTRYAVQLPSPNTLDLSTELRWLSRDQASKKAS